MIVISGCSGASQADLAQASKAAASTQAAKDAAAHEAQTKKSLEAQLKKAKAEAAAAKKAAATKKKKATATAAARRAPARIVSCGANLSVGPHTTCGFAPNVESAYYEAGGGFTTIEAYSPVTGRYYSLSCRPGTPSVCRTPDNATIYIR